MVPFTEKNAYVCDCSLHALLGQTSQPAPVVQVTVKNDGNGESELTIGKARVSPLQPVVQVTVKRSR